MEGGWSFVAASQVGRTPVQVRPGGRGRREHRLAPENPRAGEAVEKAVWRSPLWGRLVGGTGGGMGGRLVGGTGGGARVGRPGTRPVGMAGQMARGWWVLPAGDATVACRCRFGCEAPGVIA